MAREREQGMSLIELAAVMGLVGILALAAAGLLARVSQESASTQKRQGIANDVHLMGGTLQKYMATGDIRFYGFTGTADASPAPRPLSRFLIPQPGRCRDLSTCADQTAFLYVNYDKTVTASVSAFCVVAPAVVGDPYLLLVDAHDDTYGAVTAQPNHDFKVAVDGNAFTVKIHDGSPLALFDPPKAPLWVAMDDALPLTLIAAPDGSVTAPSFGPLAADCAARLKNGALPPQKLVDQVYQIRARPLRLAQFTGGTFVNPVDVTTSLGQFPMRLFSPSLRSAGVMPLPAPDPHFEASFADCTIASGTSVVSCDGPPQIRIQPVDRIRFDQQFKVSLFDAASTAVTASRFELLLGGMTASAACGPPACAPLTVPANGGIPALWGGAETFDTLKAAGFSLLKQDTISVLRLRVLVDAAKAKEEAVDVRFP